MDHLFEKHQITAVRLGKLRHLLSEGVELALPGGRRLDLLRVPNLPAVFPDDDRNSLLGTHQITAVHLGNLRTLLSESADLALSENRRLNFRQAPHLPDAFSEEAINPLIENTSYNCARIREITGPTFRKYRSGVLRR